MTEEKILKIFEENTLNDLSYFLKKRHRLNITNQWLNYSFNLLQGFSILIVAIGQAYQFPSLVWTGAGMNTLSTIFHVWETSNKKIQKSLYNNIKQIKNGNYIDESAVEMDDLSKQSEPKTPSVSVLGSQMGTLSDLI
jgi:hypothetical protein